MVLKRQAARRTPSLIVLANPEVDPGGDLGQYGHVDDRRAAPEPGERVSHYRIDEKLGEGAMGVVYQATDERLMRSVALKFLRSTPTSASHARLGAARLLREARALARLSHPNVVTIHDVGDHAGRVFMAMELIRGVTLREWLAQEARTLAATVEVFLAAGRGLAAAHRAGLVHRDFKPDNVMVGVDGRVLVTDFGVVGAIAELARRPGRLGGTPAYMAPEQLLGIDVGPASDQFSFCVSLFEALYGTRPFAAADPAESAASIRRGELVATRGLSVPSWLRTAVLTGLAARPIDRYPNMEALLAALTRDRSLRRRLGLLAAGVAAGALAAVAWGTAAAPPVCVAGEQVIAELWDSELEARVQVTVARSGNPGVPAAWEQARAALSGYSRRWRDEYDDTCAATLVRHEQSEASMDRRMACMRTQLVHVRASLELLAEDQGEEALLRIHGFEDSLRELEDCTDARRLMEGYPAPPLALSEAVERQEAELARVRALKIAGHYEDALGRARATLSQARALGYPPLLAAAAYEAGTAHSKLGDYASAVNLLEESFAVAYGVGADGVVIDAKIALLIIEGSILSDFERGLSHASTARAGLLRVGGDDQREAALESGIAAIHNQLGDLDEAERGYRRALELQEATGHPRLDLAYTLGNLGSLLLRRGDLDEAGELLERQLALLQELVGPDHPKLGSAHISLGNLHERRGEFARAQLHHEQAVQLYARTESHDIGGLGIAWANLGTLAVLQAREREGAAYLEHGMALLRERKGPRDPTVSEIALALARVELHQGETQAASERVDEVIDSYEQVFGVDGAQLVQPLTLRGEIALQRGELETAREALARALLLSPSSGELARKGRRLRARLARLEEVAEP